MVIAFYSWVYFKIKGDNICEAKIIRNILTELLSLIYYKLLRKYKAYLDIAKFMSVIKKLVKNLWLLRKGFYICIRNWRNGRVVECTGLENQRGSHLRGFESLFLRQDLFKIDESPVNSMFMGLFILPKTSKYVLKTILLVTY